MRWLLVLLACFGIALAGEAPTQVRISIERQVGYVIGDLVPYDAAITVDSNWALRRSSLPAPGRPEYWLDLRSVGVDESRDGDTHTYRIHLVYQIFYAPIEARKRTLPAFVLTFEHPGGTTNITVPSVSVTLSPLREVVTGTGDPEANVALQPDRNAPSLSLRAPLASALASTVAIVLLLAVIARQRSWGPFAKRAGAPFGRADRVLRKVELSGAEAYPRGLLILHRAFDSAAGWHVFADDVPRFLREQPQFAVAAAPIQQFFAASREYFFRGGANPEASALPAAEVRRLARRLAELERHG